MEKKTFFTEEQIKAVFTDNKYLKKAKAVLQDPRKMEELARKINKKLANIPVVGEYFADLPILCMMAADYGKGAYKEVPFATMVGIAVALVYFMTPVDLVPDAIPGLGRLDDAAVLLFAVKAAHNDIADYKTWKQL